MPPENPAGRAGPTALVTCSVSVVVILAGGMINMSKSAPNDDKKADAEKARNAAEELISAAAKRDVEKFISRLGAHTKAEYQVFQGLDALYLAAQKRFKRPGPGGTMMKELLRKFRRDDETIRVIEVLPFKRDTKKLIVWKTQTTKDGQEKITEVQWTAMKVDGRWTMTLPGKGRTEAVTRKNAKGEDVTVQLMLGGHLTRKESEIVQRRLGKEKSMLSTMKKRLENGEFRSLEEFNTAYLQAKRKIK
ncbi:MAG: hypothetical protein ACE5KM_02190 [Planctomycetaceae bacterium]